MCTKGWEKGKKGAKKELTRGDKGGRIATRFSEGKRKRANEPRKNLKKVQKKSWQSETKCGKIVELFTNTQAAIEPWKLNNDEKEPEIFQEEIKCTFQQ